MKKENDIRIVLNIIFDEKNVIHASVEDLKLSSIVDARVEERKKQDELYEKINKENPTVTDIDQDFVFSLPLKLSEEESKAVYRVKHEGYVDITFDGCDKPNILLDIIRRQEELGLSEVCYFGGGDTTTIFDLTQGYMEHIFEGGKEFLRLTKKGSKLLNSFDVEIEQSKEEVFETTTENVNEKIDSIYSMVSKIAKSDNNVQVPFIENLDERPDDCVGYVYLIIDMKTDKLYVGQSTKIDKCSILTYFGSGNEISEISKLRPQTLKKVVLRYCKTKEQLDMWEIIYIEVFNSRRNGYNIRVGGQDRTKSILFAYQLGVYGFDETETLSKTVNDIEQQYHKS